MPNSRHAIDANGIARSLSHPGRANDEVPSPCISICVIDHGLGYCIGCYRTLDEIADWINLDSGARRAVHDAISTRRKAVDEKR